MTCRSVSPVALDLKNRGVQFPGAPLEDGKPWTPWGASDDQSKALLRCVGVQRFRILSLETREPYPIARVRLFTDEEAEHKEPEFDEVY